MKKLLMVFAACGLLSTLVLNADNISFPYTLSNTDSLTAAKYKANNNAVKNVVNGNLTNANLKSTANIAQSKIDSSSGWISNATGNIKTSGNFLEIHSPKGMKLFLNDTVSYDNELVLYSDSTDSIMKMSNDSAWFYKPIGGSVTVRNRVTAKEGVFDSIKIGGGAWVKQLDIGTFAMKITKTDTTQIVFNDNVNYQVVNNSVAFTIPYSFTFSDSAETLMVSILPSGLRPVDAPKVISIGYSIGSQGDSNIKLQFADPEMEPPACLRYEIPTTATKGKIVSPDIITDPGIALPIIMVQYAYVMYDK